MGKFVYLDGQLLEKDKAKISVFDHCVLYGDGVFEGIRAYNGRVFKLEEHLKRLYNSAKIIMLDMPLSIEEFAKAIVKTCKANDIADGYIRAVVTRGVGNLGLSPWICEKPSYFIIADKIQLYPVEYYEKGLPIITVPTRRNLHEALSPLVKSCNYLNNIMAKIEAKNAGAQEAIMLNNEGTVAECTGDNIFCVRDGVLYTPSVVSGILEGITRAVVMDLARKAGYQVVDKTITRAELFISDEVFMTGTAAEVVPVNLIDGRKIGDGMPGKITKELIVAFKEYVKTTGTIIE